MSMTSVTAPVFEVDGATLLHGDCIEVMASMPDCSVDAVVTDPPYGLEFMGKEWDTFRVDDTGTARWRGDRACASGGGESSRPPDALGKVSYGAGKRAMTSRCTGCGKRDAFRKDHGCGDGARWRVDLVYPFSAPPSSLAFQNWCRVWALEALRVLKPGGHLAAFGSPRTYHRLTSGLEDAGFDVRDTLCWMYGSGFPKSMNVSKAMHRADVDDGDAHAWEGWGTHVKPAFEPIVLARKPLAGTVAANVLEHGTGALNIDACRVGEGGRFPANVVLDLEASRMLDEAVGERRSGSRRAGVRKGLGYHGAGGDGGPAIEASSGGPSRFFYCSKASRRERRGSKHPTVKPLDLMRWVVRLVTPPGGVVLDPFAGSGTTGEAARAEGFDVVLIERDDEYLDDIRTRLMAGNDGKDQ